MIPVYQEWALYNHLYQFGHLTSVAFAHAWDTLLGLLRELKHPLAGSQPAAHFGITRGCC